MPVPDSTSLTVRLTITDELMSLPEQSKQQRLKQLQATLESGGMHVDDLLPRTGVIIGRVANRAAMDSLRQLPGVMYVKEDRPVALPPVFY